MLQRCYKQNSKNADLCLIKTVDGRSRLSWQTTPRKRYIQHATFALKISSDTNQLKAKIDKWPKLTVENAADFVADHKKRGANYIKLMQENCCSLAFPTNSIPVATLELQTAVVDAAHKHGLIALGHATAIENTEIILKSGADGLVSHVAGQSPTTTCFS